MQTEAALPKFLPTWAQQLNLTNQDLQDLAQKDPFDSLDPRDQVLYDGALKFSNKHQICFDLCSAHALDLYTKKTLTETDVQDHLMTKLNQLKDSSKIMPLGKYKTIVLTGRSGEGKSTLTNHLVTKPVAKVGDSAQSKTVGADLFVSEACNLNIIDTEGLDGTNSNQNNRDLMEKLLLQIVYCLEMGASLDAIIVMWCPLKNGRSGLSKTIQTLRKAFGEEVLESCIIMIQGDWKPYAKTLNLTEAVGQTVDEIKVEYPRIPVIEYDAIGSLDEQFPFLRETIDHVKPYRKEFFEKQRRQEFINMITVFKFKMQARFEGGFTEEQKNDMKTFFETYQKQTLDIINQREKAVENRKSFWNQIFNEKNFEAVAKYGPKIVEVLLPVITLLLAKKPI